MENKKRVIAVSCKVKDLIKAIEENTKALEELNKALSYK